MSLADVTSARSSPSPEGCPDCDTSASVTSDLHKYQVACTCKPGSVQYACAEDPGPPPPAKTDTPPALPPRPPNSLLNNRRNNSSTGCTNETSCRRRKYAWWCVGCGALAAALGGLLAAQHILLRAYTASPQHLETVPAAVPAAMLVLTGVCIMSLARRRNRYSYMIKVVGACCLACALTCVLVTITTTVIHMNKLQTLKFCEYTKLTSTCTCFSMPPDTHNDEEGIRCVFEGVTNCSVVHGALYWCLRGVFALSVSAVLVCIFSCMLAYQLLSHERKKMYWEQLELRCRSLYRPPTGQTATSARPPQTTCSCCTQCHPAQPAWDISLQHRFWAPGRIGNLYSPNPGAGRKTSAWSWFPWPRSNSQNSRCRMNGVPQSGDSAYGFCDETNPNPNPTQSQTYDERAYPTNYPQPYPRTQPVNPNLGTLQSTYPNSGSYPANSGSYPPNSGSYPPNSGSYPPNSGSYPPNSGSYPPNSGSYPPNSGSYPPNSSSFPTAQFAQGYQEGFGESSGSYDAQTGVWGPPPPYSPQGRSGSRHHLHHPDPATATLLHHHMDVHRNSALIHDHQLPNQNCRNSYMLQPLEMARINPELARLNPELARLNPELARLNPELARLNPDFVRMNPELARINPELARLNPELVRLNPEMAHLAQIYPPDELARLQVEMARLGSEGRFNTLRGHLVPYRNCPRSLGLSTGNLRDCRLDDNLTVECLHQKSSSKVSDQSSDSGPKLGKENLGFQNDKNSPLRSSMQDCHRALPNAESEVYFADVSSCCNVSVKADCCAKPNLSLVGTIENHPESTSESDTGSFTLSRQQRPQPQVGSKRRPKPHEKHVKEKRHDANSSLRLTEQQIEQLNHSMREQELSERIVERMNERMQRIDSRDRLNDSRMNESRMNESRMSDSRFESRMNDSRMNDSRTSDSRMNDSRNMNDSRMSDRLNDSRLSDRLNESRMIERMNESRMSERKERFEERRMSDLNASFKEGSPKMTRSPLRLRTSPKNLPLEHLRQSSSDSNKGEFSGRQNSPKEYFANNVQNLPTLSPISPNTEESLLSDDEETKPYANEPESSKCLGPDAQYEKVREKEECLKTNHNRCCSDSNTMDSGWQSGSEKQVTD